MVRAFALLLLAQLVGEGLVRISGAPVPGPVVGLMVLAVGLAIRERLPAGRLAPLGSTDLGRTAAGLLGHLSLLFVPAAVGVVQQGPVLARSGMVLAVAIAVSTVLTLAVTAATFVWALRFVRLDRLSRPDEGATR